MRPHGRNQSSGQCSGFEFQPTTNPDTRNLSRIPLKAGAPLSAVEASRTGENKISTQGTDKLNHWFQTGKLVRPSAEALNFVDLTRALAQLGGVEGVAGGAGAAKLRRIIGDAEHYLFVLVDGLGVAQSRKLPSGSFLRSRMVEELQAVCFTTTAAALTTLATGQWPCAHGIPGWWTYLGDKGISAAVLPFQERSSERPLQELGLDINELFPAPSFWAGFKSGTKSFLPAEIADSPYSRYASGEQARIGYAGLAEAIVKTRESVLNAAGPSFTYLYLPQLDALAHKKGTEDLGYRDLLTAIDEHLDVLARSLAGRARLVITGDHGGVNVAPEKKFVLAQNDALGSRLQCPPTGEPVAPIFHVKAGQEKAFASEFNDRFGEYFALLTPDEIEEMRFLGPAELTPVMHQRMGTFAGIAGRPAVFYVRPWDEGVENVGFHGGLTGTEIHIPLILA